MLNWIRLNPSQAIGFFFTAVSLGIPVVGAIADDATPLGADPRVFFLISAAMLAVTIAGRVWQKVKGSVPVSWGFSSIIGFASMLVAEIVGVITDLTTALEPFHISPAFWYAVGAGLGIATKALRYFQAVEPFLKGGAGFFPEPVDGTGGADEPVT
ncbi:MAG: hypothetical protein H0W81_11955 [Chloroflexi bacterium]|nr:hypothetical protein [Chloroflexota bacterium]